MPLNLRQIVSQGDPPAEGLTKLASQGVSEATAAEMCGVTLEEFQAELARNETLGAAWHSGQCTARANLERGLHKAAQSGNADSARLWLQLQNLTD